MRRIAAGESSMTGVRQARSNSRMVLLSIAPAWRRSDMLSCSALRTTCVATRLPAGHAQNALPQLATAVVNCRLLPVDKAADIKRTLEQVLADSKITLTEMNQPVTTPYTPIDPKVMAAVTASTNKFWPGLPVVPAMETGATDGTRMIRAGIPRSEEHTPD